MPNHSDASPALLTAHEVAKLLRVAPNTIYKWARAGVIQPVKVGGAVRFRAADIDALIEAAAS